MKNKEVKENPENLNPYKLDKLSRIPSWLIILLLKFWAAAAAVFFSVIGGLDVGIDFSGTATDPVSSIIASIRIIVLIALFISIFINYLVRPFVRLMYNKRNNTYRYNMINFKGFLSFVVCLLYHLVLSIILFFITIFLSMHHLVLDLFGTTGGVGIEPFTYAFCYMLVDFIFLFAKNVIVDSVKRYKYHKQMKAEV